MIEKLFKAISEKNNKLVELMNLFGDDYWYAQNMLREIEGMKEAFQIIAGHSYTDHLIMKIAV